MALISVIVPIYGVEKYLNKCVESLVNQTYSNLEIVLVDDGSPDNCGKICDEWAEKDTRIKVVHKENGGLSDARNAGLAVATGAYVSFIDSDDYVELTFIEKLYTALSQNNADIAECATRYVTETGEELKVREATDGIYEPIIALEKLVQEKGLYQTVWNKLYTKEVVGDILFAKGKYNEDEFWTYKIFDRANKIVSVSDVLYNYLQRGSSIIGVGYNIRRLDGVDALFERMQYLSKYPELKDLLCQNFVLGCLWHLQSVMRTLKGEQKKQTVKKIVSMIKATPKVKKKDLTVTGKYKFWYKFFRTTPKLCAKIRNVLKIGL